MVWSSAGSLSAEATLAVQVSTRARGSTASDDHGNILMDLGRFDELLDGYVAVDRSSLKAKPCIADGQFEDFQVRRKRPTTDRAERCF